ncbi:MAG: BlaI/MecI/CopY family transcriptional regulator [Pyrinomonadaceae bacterium]
MAIKKKARLTRFELEVMNALWKMERASIREMQELYPEKKRPAYTTVQTIVYRLEAKGAVRRTKKIGNAHIFEPSIAPEAAFRRVIEDTLTALGGSVRPLLDYLADNRKLTPEDLRYLQAKVTLSTKNAAALQVGNDETEKTAIRQGSHKQRKKAA